MLQARAHSAMVPALGFDSVRLAKGSTMRFSILTNAALFAVVAVASDCGPPPVPMTGTLHYNSGCRQTGTNPACTGSEVFFNAATDRSGSPPAQLNCVVDRSASAGPVRIRFVLSRTAGAPDTGDGMAVCGSVAAAGSALTNGWVNVYRLGNNSLNNMPPVCDVVVTELGTTSFAGRVKCVDAPSGTAPPSLYYVRGVTSGMNPTATTEWGEFSFISCSEGLVNCM